MCRYTPFAILSFMIAAGAAVLPSIANAAPKPGAAAADTALAPEDSKIEFVGSKADGKHAGGFSKFTGSWELGSGDVTASKIKVEIDMDSTYSDNEKLTGHLKSPDFFEVRKYPTATFTSTSIKAAKGKDVTHTITGDLTLHGVKKPISFPAKITSANGGLTLTSSFDLSRKEFGIVYGEGKVNDAVAMKVTLKAASK